MLFELAFYFFQDQEIENYRYPSALCGKGHKGFKHCVDQLEFLGLFDIVTYQIGFFLLHRLLVQIFSFDSS
jgi:hypothetical protein